MKQLFLLIIAMSCMNFFGQTPLNDRHWEFSWEDEFNTLDTRLWLVKNNAHDAGDEPVVYTNRPENVCVNDGKLVIEAKEERIASQNGRRYDYTSGFLETILPEYNTQYGFIEARIKLDHGRGFWPAFWTFVGPELPVEVNAAEIDIFEMLGSHPRSPYVMTTNIHREYCSPNRPDYIPGSNGQCLGIPNYYKEYPDSLNAIFHHTAFNYALWHNYAIEWSPLRIIWYVDDMPIRELVNHGIVDPVRIILNFGIERHNLPDITTFFPAKMLVDYVKVYRLRQDCETVLTLCNYNFGNYDHRVKKRIVMGDGGCANILLPGQNVSLRASEYVLINGEFTVPLGAGLYINGTDCY